MLCDTSTDDYHHLIKHAFCMEPVYSLKMRLPQKHIFTYVPVSLLKAYPMHPTCSCQSYSHASEQPTLLIAQLDVVMTSSLPAFQGWAVLLVQQTLSHGFTKKEEQNSDSKKYIPVRLMKVYFFHVGILHFTYENSNLSDLKLPVSVISGGVTLSCCISSFHHVHI